MSYKSMDEILAESKKTLSKRSPMKPPQKGAKPKRIEGKEPKRPRADGTTR